MAKLEINCAKSKERYEFIGRNEPIVKCVNKVDAIEFKSVIISLEVGYDIVLSDRLLLDKTTTALPL